SARRKGFGAQAETGRAAGTPSLLYKGGAPEETRGPKGLRGTFTCPPAPVLRLDRVRQARRDEAEAARGGDPDADPRRKAGSQVSTTSDLGDRQSAFGNRFCFSTLQICDYLLGIRCHHRLKP